MKLIIAGGRKFNDAEMLTEYLNTALKDGTITPNENGLEIVSGMAAGADKLGVLLAEQNGLVLHKFYANWRTEGRSAGFARNMRMGDFADALLACWDGKSKGTLHMINYMKRLGKPVYILHYEETE